LPLLAAPQACTITIIIIVITITITIRLCPSFSTSAMVRGSYTDSSYSALLGE
jgi:hypothetical protein